MKEDYQKAFKKLTLFFLSYPAPFNGQKYQIQAGSGTNDESLFRLQNKFKKIPFLSYVLSDQVWQFLSYPKNLQIYAGQFMTS